MRWFSEQRVRWTVVFCRLAISVLISASCATAPSNRKYVGSIFDPKTSSRAEESFPNLWEKWTVDLGTGMRDGRPWHLSSPLAMGEGRGGPGGDFPLHITATLMDTMLIEAGLRHYETRLAMTQQEREEFHRTYFQRYDVENHLLIWCEMQTTWTELYLDLDRWTIFIEDDALNQYELVKVFERSQPTRQMGMDAFPEFRSERRLPRWEVHQKSLMLCFPKRDFYQNPVLSPKVKFLKLVFQLNDDEKTRAEGIWVFKK